MGAQKSVHAGKAKIDFNVDLTHKLCSAFLFPSHFRIPDGPFSQIVARLCVQHPSLFGRGEKLEAVFDKGLCESNFVLTLRPPKPDWLAHRSFVLQYCVSPDVSESLTNTTSGGVNMRHFSAGVDLNEPLGTNWSSTTSVKFESFHPVDDAGRTIYTDREGFPITGSGTSHDSMMILRQDSRYAVADDHNFSRLNFQIDQGITLLSNWRVFNRFKFKISKGIKLGPTFLLASLAGGSIVGNIAPYQAFPIGGLGSVRGYGVGAVGSGRSCLIANSELTIPLMKQLEGAIFVDYGTDLGTAQHVPGNPALRQGKPGRGVGFGYGLRFNLPVGQLQVDYAVNNLKRKTVYIGVASTTT